MYLYSGISHIARNIIIIALDIFARLPRFTPLVRYPTYTYVYYSPRYSCCPNTYPTFLIVPNIPLGTGAFEVVGKGGEMASIHVRARSSNSYEK